jgi:hypothetical protein
MSSADIVECADAVAPAPAASTEATTVATIPRSLCPGTEQYASYEPSSRAGTSSDTVAPTSMEPVSYVVPLASRANVWSVCPMFMTANEMGMSTGTWMVEGEISKSDSMTSTLVGALAACSPAGAPVVLPPLQLADTSARTPNIAMARPRIDPCMGVLLPMARLQPECRQVRSPPPRPKVPPSEGPTTVRSGRFDTHQ